MEYNCNNLVQWNSLLQYSFWLYCLMLIEVNWVFSHSMQNFFGCLHFVLVSSWYLSLPNFEYLVSGLSHWRKWILLFLVTHFSSCLYMCFRGWAMVRWQVPSTKSDRSCLESGNQPLQEKLGVRLPTMNSSKTCKKWNFLHWQQPF